jgi:hypothetical protein
MVNPNDGTTVLNTPKSAGACLVAGTLVHTKDGLKPIEQIQVGDWVLSQPEDKGEQAYKRVVNTFSFEDKAVRPFSHKARSYRVRTHTLTAQSPHLRHFALVTRALQIGACSPCLAAPSMRFLFIDSRFTLHDSFPHSVTLMQLRFTSLAVTSSRQDLHPQVCTHAGRTPTNGSGRGFARPILTR